MNQVYIPYWEWEDWINGMWRRIPKEEESVFLDLAIKFTGDYLKYGKAMKEVVLKWPKTMLNSLTNKSINRRAFLGHCACQYKINCPEYIVRMAWKQLNDKERYLADKIAQETINNWEYDYKNKGIHKNMGEQMLFRWDS